MMKRVSWKQKNKKQKAIFVAIIVLITVVSVTVYALDNDFFHLRSSVDNSRGVKIAGSWTGDDIEGKEVIPGDTFTLSQEITSTSTEPVYVFVRIDTEENAYSISDLDPDWTVAKEADGVILLGYGSADTMTEVAPDATVEFGGLLTLDVSNSQFADLPDEALDFNINACGVGKSQCENFTAPLDVYVAYEESGGN